MDGPTPSLVVSPDAQSGARRDPREQRDARPVPLGAIALAAACLAALVAYRGFLHFDRFAGRPSGFDETTGFLFETLLQLDYNYNFGVLRRGDYGGNEVTFHVSKSF